MKSFLSTILKIGVTAALLYWVAVRYDVSKVLRADPGLMGLAVLMFILSNFIGALQWQLLLRGQGIGFAFRRAVNLYFIGLFFNNFLPSALGGDVVKVYSLSKVEKRGREGLAATFVDRFAGLTVLALFALFGSLWLILTGAEAVQRDILNYIAVVFLVFVAVTVLLFSRRVGRFIYGVLLPGFNPLGLTDKFREGHEFFHTYRHQYALATRVLVLSVLIQLARVAVHYLTALAIGFEIDFIYFMVFVPLIAMVAIIPISFGGLGVRESTAPFLFTSVASIAAIDSAASLAATQQLLASLVGIVVGLIGGVLFVVTRSTSGMRMPPKVSGDPYSE